MKSNPPTWVSATNTRSPNLAGPKPSGLNDEDLTTALPGGGEHARLHDLASGTDGNIAVGAVIGSRYGLSGEESTNLSQTRHRAPVAKLVPRVKDNPDFTFAAAIVGWST